MTTTDARKRLQDAMQAHDDRSPGETAPATGPDRHESDLEDLARVRALIRSEVEAAEAESGPEADVEEVDRVIRKTVTRIINTWGASDPDIAERLSGAIRVSLAQTALIDRAFPDDAEVSVDTPEAHGGAESVVERPEGYAAPGADHDSEAEWIARRTYPRDVPRRLRTLGWVDPDEARRLREENASAMAAVEQWREEWKYASTGTLRRALARRRLTGERDRARQLAADLEAENARLTERNASHVRREQSEERFARLTPCTCSAQRERADAAELAREDDADLITDLMGKVDAAEERARRYEDALRRVAEVSKAMQIVIERDDASAAEHEPTAFDRGWTGAIRHWQANVDRALSETEEANHE